MSKKSHASCSRRSPSSVALAASGARRGRGSARAVHPQRVAVVRAQRGRDVAGDRVQRRQRRPLALRPLLLAPAAAAQPAVAPACPPPRSARAPRPPSACRTGRSSRSPSAQLGKCTWASTSPGTTVAPPRSTISPAASGGPMTAPVDGDPGRPHARVDEHDGTVSGHAALHGLPDLRLRRDVRLVRLRARDPRHAAARRVRRARRRAATVADARARARCPPRSSSPATRSSRSRSRRRRSSRPATSSRTTPTPTSTRAASRRRGARRLRARARRLRAPRRHARSATARRRPTSPRRR